MTIMHLTALATLGIGVPLNAYVTVRLWRLARANPTLLVIRDRAIVATAILVIVIVFSLFYLNNDLADPVVSVTDTTIIRRVIILAVAVVPATYWLWLYREG